MRKIIKQAISISIAAALLIPSGWFAQSGGAVANAAEDTVTVYHETFANGQGAAVQSGGATLTVVTDKVFEGNEDGTALYVGNRSNNWDAADFYFDKIGLKNGKNYTVTVKGYVDAGAQIPADAQAFLQTADKANGWLAGTNYKAGEAFTLSKEFTLDTSTGDTRLRVQSNDDGKKVPFYIGDILITSKSTSETVEKEIYHETFESSIGKAEQSGNAKLEKVAGKVFDGNADGGALSVTERAQGHDAADFKYSNIGLENGKTYTVTTAVYVDPDVAVPSGAQVFLQTADIKYGFLASADFVPGKAVTLTKEFTVDTSTDNRLRIQSNDKGATVPFYIGYVRITEKVASGGEEEPPREPALPFTTITFEDQKTGGFVGRGGVETLTVTDEANHTEGGLYALKVEGRQENWQGPSLRVEKYVDKGSEYKVTAWVKLISPASSEISLSSQIGESSPNYPELAKKTISVGDGWVQLEGTYRYNSVGGEYLTIYLQSPSVDTTFYIDDISFEKLASEPIEIQKDLIPIKNAYQNDFLIGNAISGEDLEGLRLDLLKMHHNVATAGNAMKPDALQPKKGEFSFSGADAMVNKVLAEGMQMHGHVLVWHQQSPAWMNTITEQGNTIPLSRDVALTNLRTHIKTVVEHFGDRVISWDVVNEAMSDNPSNPTDWENALRTAPWKTAIGPDYVEQAFLAAREVLDEHPEWNIKLYYNDYNEDNQNKATAIYSMVKEINDRYAETHPGKLLIDGIGMQAHYNVNTNPENVKLSLEKFISLGVEISVTELDIMAGDKYQLSEKLASAQGYLYAQLFNLYKENAEHIKRVTFWGLDDGSSWRAENNPLLFDKQLQAKPAYYGVIDPDKFIEEHEPDSSNANQSTANYATPVIDGTIDAVWNQAPAMSLNRYQTAWQGANGVAKALWDDQNLYVLIQVNDAQLDKSNVNAWEQDSVEIFLDENNAKSTFYQDDDGQFRVNFDNETSFSPEKIGEGFVSATQVSGTNYTVEVKIPFKKITPSNNVKVGFDAQINDAKDGSRQSVAAWNDTTGNGYQDTSVYGVLTLTGKPGKPGDNGNGNTGGNSGGSGGTSGGSATQPKPVEPAGGVIKPEVKVAGGVATATVSGDNLKKALEQAAPAANGKKQISIEVPQQANATSYDVQLPTQSLNGQENFVILLKTEHGTIEIPSNMLSNVTENAGQVSIRIAKASLDELDAASREAIDNRPALDLSIAVDGKAIAWNNPKAPVTVAIPYKPTAAELSNPNSIVVWYLEDNGSVTPVPNGRYDAVSGSVVFQTTHFSSYAVAYVSKTFGDLQNVPWAKQAIDAMAARDVIRGTAENAFSPASSIKRADFIALLVNGLELKGSGKGQPAAFSDVQPNASYSDALAIAKELGIVTGYADNTFKPNSPISRQEMMVLTTRALTAAGKQAAGSATLDAYTDAAQIADFAKASAAALVQAGIVNGKDGKIAPAEALTRAEAAVILYRIWKL